MLSRLLLLSARLKDEKMSTKFNTIFSFTSALTLHYIVLLILSVAVCSSGCFQGPPLPNKPFITVWDTPTDQCKPKWNVSLDLGAFDIVVNKDQKWCGEYIVIFYNTQLGLYPYFDSNGKTFNGGLPQLGNLTAHLIKVEQDVANVIPDNEFQGIGVIDWEYWRPVFDRNWDELSIYRNKSMELVKQRHPLWPDSLVEDIARVEFETAAREFMEETLLLVQKLRPKSLWGFYGFPNCYNDKDADNCSQVTMKYNDQISWLFEWSSVLFPSIYLYDKAKLNGTLFVKYRLLESFRFAKKLDGSPIPVFPYVRITYAVSQVYLNVGDIMSTILQSAEQGTAGVVIWGDHHSEATKTDCIEIKNYIDNFLGPLVKSITSIAQNCSQEFCNLHGRCKFQLNPDLYFKASSLEVNLDFLSDQWKFLSCRCYSGWSGEDCRHHL